MNNKTTQPTLYVMSGLPGSGKSTWALEFAKVHEFNYLSSDEIRKKLFGSYSCMKNHDAVFSELNRTTAALLKEGKSVVYDATNLSRDRRTAIAKVFKINCRCRCECVYMSTPLEMCIANDSKRDPERVVGAGKIKHMAENGYIPNTAEGWDDVRIIQNNQINSELYLTERNEVNPPEEEKSSYYNGWNNQPMLSGSKSTEVYFDEVEMK